MAADQGIALSQWIGWGVTALAFAGNLYWNALNREHTNKIANDIRRENFERDVWERHRARIDDRLEELTSYVSELPGQLLALPLPSDSKTLEIWGYNLTLLHDSLARALTEADASAYCDGSAWEALASGNVHGSESSWDLVLSLFEEARISETEDARLKKLKKMNVYVMEIERVIRARMRDADFRYQP